MSSKSQRIVRMEESDASDTEPLSDDTKVQSSIEFRSNTLRAGSLSEASDSARKSQTRARSSAPADDSSSDSVEIDIDDPDWLERSVGDVYTRKRPVFSRASRTSSANQYGSSTTLNAASVTLSWNDLNVYVRDKDGQPGRHILKGLTGAAMPGQLIALMGASGAGKSTFMNSLVQRNTRGLIITGEVYVNGQVIGRDITAIAAYVQQDDLFSGGLTVREHMIFQAMLRLPADMSYRDKIRRVDQVWRSE